MCEEFKRALVNHLKNGNIYPGDDKCCWTIEELPIYGRCLIANRDIQPNEEIFRDKPLIVGPRVNNYNKIFCISCYKVLNKLSLCSQKCKFPVCSECENNDAQHRVECELIRSWKLKNENKYSKHLFRALTVIRGLLLSKEESELMFMMACHENTSVQNMEVEKILVEFDGLSEDSEIVNKLKKISSILNTNAFEVGLPHDSQPEHGISLRGLFPLGAVMNHNCIPNIYYVYNDHKVMIAKASKLIKRGDQIFNSYTKLLWGTMQRRVHLGYSKNFLCKCERCLDPKEFNSNISGIKCIHPQCDSIMLPINPLVITSSWKCEKCNFKLDHARISKITDILSKQIFNRISNEPMKLINQYLKEKLSNFLPDSNQLTIELKLQIILKMKQESDYIMTIEDFQDIENYCQNILNIIDMLTMGECFVKGILCHELAVTKIKLSELQGHVLNKETRENLSVLLKKSWDIIGNSISEPKDLKDLLNSFT
ncbi:SET domain-containing protein SmydA-8-like [Chironomus tepperi]|uniref:SET domain-containing protein SmydA-8-like n=1 Tax=Chironomus tepperi TaxID=113505 RepID=UPI00391F274E